MLHIPVHPKKKRKKKKKRKIVNPDSSSLWSWSGPHPGHIRPTSVLHQAHIRPTSGPHQIHRHLLYPRLIWVSSLENVGTAISSADRQPGPQAHLPWTGSSSLLSGSPHANPNPIEISQAPAWFPKFSWRDSSNPPPDSFVSFQNVSQQKRLWLKMERITLLTSAFGERGPRTMWRSQSLKESNTLTHQSYSMWQLYKGVKSSL